MHKFSNIILGIIILTARPSFAEGEKFEPTSKEKLAKFYSTPERSATVTVHEGRKLHSIDDGFLGIDISYFNVTDEIWKKYGILEKLKAARVGSLRYPGGMETESFHWEHPGVNGYEDLWDPNESHGTAPGRGRFQATWVPPDKWSTNKNFMDFDEFMKACQALNAEPIVGLNLTSGVKHNRHKEGVEEALRWLRYCKQKNYKVKYWYLDCETWNHGASYTFKDNEYADEVNLYGHALKAEFPDIKLIANPTSSTSYNYFDWLEKFVVKTKDVVDYLDVHWYWASGIGTFDYWKKPTPLTTGDKWKKPEWDRPYAEDINLIKQTCIKAGAPDMGLVALEWNIGPSNGIETFSQQLIAVIQAEVLMEYLRDDVRLTCLWTLIWQSSREVWSEQDFFPSIITQEPPYAPTLTLDMFRLFSAVKGKSVIASETPNKDLPVVAAADDAGHRVLFIINKNSLRRKVTINLDNKATKASAEMLALKHQLCQPEDITVENEKQLFFYAEPYSFNVIKIE
jgi:alpha-N-arabinofuranosidase